MTVAKGDMRVLVTGIDGFVGSHLAEFLLGIPGVEVHGIVHPDAQGTNIRHLAARLTLHRLDILHADAVGSVIERVQPARIIHLAAQAFIPVSMSDPERTFRTNISGGLSLLEAARKVGGGKAGGPAVLIVSSGEVYGKVPPESQPITEDCPLRPSNPYAVSKACIDLISQDYRRSFGLNVKVVRPFNHAGPRQSPVFVCSDFGRQIASISLGKTPPRMSVGNINARRDFTDVRDVIRAYWMIFDSPPTDDVFNVCSGASLRIGDIVAMLETIAGISVEITSDQSRLRPYDIPTIVGSYERLRTVTGWSPSIPITRTLNDVYAYWRDQLTAAV